MSLMKLPKNIKWKQEKKGGVAAVLRFFVRHGEKIAAGVLVGVAVWIALQAQNFQPLPWKPNELVELADDIDNTIKNNASVAMEEKITLFDYATYAEQIKTQISPEPYRSTAEWKPVIQPSPLPRGGFGLLTAESLKGEAVRRTGLTAQGKSLKQWQRPPLPEMLSSSNSASNSTSNNASIWVNVYGTIPLWAQWDIYNQVFNNHTPETNRPEYVYYEVEKAEINPAKINFMEELVWQPVIVYPDYPADALPTNFDVPPDFSPDRLIPLAQGTSQEEYASSALLFSDFEVEPARTYAYRIRLYLVNPNYHLQESSVQEGVDTINKFLRSDWSGFARVSVPDRTLVQIQSVMPTDPAEFPRQTAPLRPIRGTVFLDYFDVELGQTLPLVEKTDLQRGMLCNMSKNDAIKYINRGKTTEEFVNINYPDAGLRSDVCIMDLSGGRKLQKKASRESQGSPDLSTAGKALLLMPDGTMQVTSTEQELFR
jgi:hypothetical protein